MRPKKYCTLLVAGKIIFPTMSALAAPPRHIPEKYLDRFTMNNTIPIVYRYFDQAYPSTHPITYKKGTVNAFLSQIAKGTFKYYHATLKHLRHAFEAFPRYIDSKNVAVLGSRTPRCESVVIYYGGRPTSIDYNKVISLDERIKTMTLDEYRKNPVLFDTLVSVSSFEHDGLGRYGDPIDPDGDLRAMQESREMLKDGGVLFLAVPTGEDCIKWNANRVYGKKRLPLLLNGWELIGFFGLNPNLLGSQPLDSVIQYPGVAHQPVIVLKKTTSNLSTNQRAQANCE